MAKKTEQKVGEVSVTIGERKEDGSYTASINKPQAIDAATLTVEPKAPEVTETVETIYQHGERDGKTAYSLDGVNVVWLDTSDDIDADKVKAAEKDAKDKDNA